MRNALGQFLAGHTEKNILYLFAYSRINQLCIHYK